MLDQNATRPIGGFRILDTRSDELVEALDLCLKKRQKALLFFANANFVSKCSSLRHEISSAPSIVVNDGLGMKLASSLLYRAPFRENMNGTDFVPFLLENVATPRKVFLFGDHPDTVRDAASLSGRYPAIETVGFCDGYDFESEYVVEAINRSGADIVLVGMGNPLQEQWILRHHEKIDAPLIVGVGALFTWATGKRRRAPEPIRKLQLEWLYRLALEPRRLGHRYTIGMFEFFRIVVASR